MTDTVAYIAIAMTVLLVLFLTASVIVKTWRDGSLQSDLKWMRGAFRIYARHTKTWLNNN